MQFFHLLPVADPKSLSSQMISELYVFDELGSETSVPLESMQAAAHGEFGVTCKEKTWLDKARSAVRSVRVCLFPEAILLPTAGKWPCRNVQYSAV